MSSSEMTKEEAEAKGIELVARLNGKIKNFPKADGFDTYEPRETDIVVTTFPKSGTTMTQQLTYQTVIATGGACEKDPDGMTFDDICEVAPFVDFGPKHGFVDFESSPRIYKSHSVPVMFQDTVQKHLVVLRNPESYPASALDFMFEEWAGEKVTNTDVLETVYRQFLAQRILGLGKGFNPKDSAKSAAAADDDDDNDDNKEEDKVLYFQQEEKKDDSDKLTLGPWFMHSKSWINAMRPNIFFMFYEDIVKDIGKAAQRIAAFMGRELDEAGVKQVVERCDRDYMAKDKKFKCTLENKALGFGENSWKAKPLDHKGFSFKIFKPTVEEKEQIKLRFRQEFGVDTYEELKEIIVAKQKELGVNF